LNLRRNSQILVYSYGSYESSVASVAFSIDEYRVENGRLYHTYFGDNKNPLPVDEVRRIRSLYLVDLLMDLLVTIDRAAAVRCPP
jgi:hypothetical protein